ncbi:MAG: DUF177 domain-containing protein [Thermodesulfobacteriota bacterium]|nr:DUF177 domain-containing protein [Thermodesulfobacteriota bacterium]
MQINISNIPEEGLNLRFSKSGEWVHQSLPEGDESVFRVHEIEVQCFVEKALKNVSIKGRMCAGIELECCRCLERFDLPVDIEFKYVLMPADDIKENEIELTYEDLEYSHYEGDTIDLGQIIAEQIVLQIPVKPLCSDSCEGLCPVCGINRNMEKCGHATQQTISPFASLKNFKAKKER